MRCIILYAVQLFCVSHTHDMKSCICLFVCSFLYSFVCHTNEYKHVPSVVRYMFCVGQYAPNIPHGLCDVCSPNEMFCMHLSIIQRFYAYYSIHTFDQAQAANVLLASPGLAAERALREKLLSRGLNLRSRVVGVRYPNGCPEWEIAARQLAANMKTVSEGFLRKTSGSLPFYEVVANAREWHELGEGTPDFTSLAAMDRRRVAVPRRISFVWWHREVSR